MSFDSPDINASNSGSRLLSLDSPAFPSDSSQSRTGLGGDDLSISELSLSDPDSILNKPFSLLAKFNPKPPSSPTTINHNEDLVTPTRTNPRIGPAPIPEVKDKEAHGDAEVEDKVKNEDDDEDEEVVRQRAREKRDEKLKSDIFILKKLNAALEQFYDSLEETVSANERVAAQIVETDALLNKYISILSKSEEFSRLIFDEKWGGAEADEQEFVLQKQEQEEQVRRAAEEKARKELEEQERLEREKEEQRRKEERERVEREKVERAIRGGVRGVRGTRASTRGRGTMSTRGSATTTTGSSRGGIPKRPPSSSSSIAGGSGIPRVSYRPS